MIAINFNAAVTLFRMRVDIVLSLISEKIQGSISLE